MPYAEGCKGCGSPCDATRCEGCKAERRDQERARRVERKQKRQCWVCAKKCVPGLTSCETHRGIAWRS